MITAFRSFHIHLINLALDLLEKNVHAELQYSKVLKQRHSTKEISIISKEQQAGVPNVSMVDIVDIEARHSKEHWGVTEDSVIKFFAKSMVSDKQVLSMLCCLENRVNKAWYAVSSLVYLQKRFDNKFSAGYILRRKYVGLGLSTYFWSNKCLLVLWQA